MKKVFACLLLVSLLLTLVGCASSQGNKQPSPKMNANNATSTTVPTSAPTTQPTTTPTTSPTTTPIVLPTAPDKDPSEFEYKPADIPQEYWAVLNNQQAICFFIPIWVQDGYDTRTEEMAYLDVIQLRGDVDELAASKCSYSVMDMDGDGNSELLILNHSVLILSHKDGIVYGWNGLGAVDIYKDGTYSWGKQAGANYGRSRIVYVGFGIWTSVEMWRVDRYLLDEPEYYLGNQLVTKETFDRYQDANNTDDIEWKALSRYPLYSRDEKYPLIEGG